jgi:type II secretory pathway pseudopilin PulG
MIRNETDPRDPRGSFTLTEVVVAALLMIIVVWALLSAFASAKRSDAIAQARLAAQQAARNAAEQLWTNVYSNIVSITNVTLNNTPLENLQGRLNRNVIASTNNYKDIAITVEWLTPGASSRQALTNFMTICDTN